MLLFVAAALAGAPSDLNGRWALDLAASQPVDAMLQAVGASWTTRQMAAHLSVTQEITVGAGSVTIAAVSNLGQKAEVVPTDGQGWAVKSEFGSGTRRCSWAGGDLVCTSRVQVTGGAWADLGMVRRVEADGALHQHLTLSLDDGRVFTADRVYRKG